MNLILIGYRGTGKSTVGRILAGKLGRTVVSTDSLIVESAGKPIPEIVQEKGWDAFRDMETEVIRELSTQENLIIDCGGGAVLREENRRILKSNGKIFWLKASVETIVGRIQGDTQRPSLTGKKSFTEEVEEVLRERTPIYQQTAYQAVETDGKTPEQVAKLVLDGFQNRRDDRRDLPFV